MKFLEELDLEEGRTLTTDCPVCKGKKKFTATRVDDMILYNCFRNSCTVKGVKKVTTKAKPSCTFALWESRKGSQNQHFVPAILK